MYSGPTLKKHSLVLSREATSLERTQIHGSMCYACDAPLPKGLLSNKDRIIWQKGCPYQRGGLLRWHNAYK